eukprot:Ihof_evm10s85 gene=Ihof_evmTU10s85
MIHERAKINKGDQEILTTTDIGYKRFFLDANLLDALFSRVLDYDVTRATCLAAWFNHVDYSKAPIM